jgi:four helix bundle protein
MSNGPEIESRAMEYAVRAVQFFRHLKATKDEVALIIGRQYLRSATGIGANLVEARAGESRKDFIHKCTIAQKEARESLYWLELAAKVGLVSENRLAPLIQETRELLAIITRIVRNTKARTIPKPPSIH